MSSVLKNLLTVVIPVKNEEKNLPECLEAVKGLEHVIVVDSGSTDSTCEIAAKWGREVVQFKWNGLFPKKRNWILRNYQFKTPWVMFLDADEFPKDDFWSELERVLPGTEFVGFWVGYDVWFLGRVLRHGLHVWKTAILKVGYGEYEPIMEERWSNLDMEIHEHIAFKGDVGRLHARIEHHDMKTLTAFYNRHNEYSSWEVERFEKIKDLSRMTARQKIKYAFFKSKLFPLFYFFVIYVFKGGFLDGQPGFFYAVSKLCHHYQIRAKYFEMKHCPKRQC